jgi:hypothetical protein
MQYLQQTQTYSPTRTDVVCVSNNCLLLTPRHIFDIDQAGLDAFAGSGIATGLRADVDC